jgi:hypothetical protein
MIYDRFAQALNTLPLISPQDTAATALASPFVKLGGSHGGTLFVHFGAITATSADQAILVTLEAATVGVSGGEAAVGFSYRLSGAVESNTWGAITAATTTGASIATDDDNKMLAIDINPSELLAQKADATYVRVVVTPDAGGTVSLVSAFVQLEPRYSQATMVSAT